MSLAVLACSDRGSDGRAAVPAAGSADSHASIRSALNSYYGDFSARDWDAFASHFWPGATLTTVWQPPGDTAPRVVSTSVSSFVRQAPSGPGSKPVFEERMLSADIRVHGNLAHAWARYVVRFGDSSDIDTWRGIDAFTLIWHDGRWRITSLAYTDE